MNGLEKILAELTNEMCMQECYRNYLESLQVIKKDADLYEELNDYRRKNVEIHLNKKTLKEKASLEKEFRGLLLKEPIREFIYWEHKTMEMIRMLHEEIDKSLELDIGFF